MSFTVAIIQSVKSCIHMNKYICESHRKSIGKQCIKVTFGKAKGICGIDWNAKGNYHFSILYISLFFDFLNMSHGSFTQI